MNRQLLPNITGILDEKLKLVFQEVNPQRTPGEVEFHQTVREVLGSLGPVLVKHPEFGEHKLIERICEPERQTSFWVSWQDYHVTLGLIEPGVGALRGATHLARRVCLQMVIGGA